MKFWHAHPALFWGFCLYVGVALGAGASPWIALLLLCGWAGWRWSLGGAIVVLLAACWVTATHRLPDCPDGSLEGEAVVVIDTGTARRSFFGLTQYYRIEVREFWVEGCCVGKRIPSSLYLPLKRGGPEVGGCYRVQGRLKRSERGSYQLKVGRTCAWEPMHSLRWIPRLRHALKMRLQKKLTQRLRGHKAKHLLSGLATGDFSDPELLLGFGRLGLQHLMAISGFHFSIIAGVLAISLRTWLPPRQVAAVVALLLSSYCVFVGPAPSVMRAWVMALLACLALWTGRKTVPLNGLGVALAVVVLSDPLSVCTMGFQFSFACTAALLAFCTPIQRWLGPGIMRRGVAAMLAVNLIAAPLTLACFHRFPLVGLLTNLAFPVAIGLLMVLLGIALLFEGWVPIFGGCTFFLVETAARVVVWAVREMPAWFDFTVRIPGIPPFVLAGMGVVLMACAVWAPRVYAELHGQARATLLLRGRRIFPGAGTS